MRSGPRPLLRPRCQWQAHFAQPRASWPRRAAAALRVAVQRTTDLAAARHAAAHAQDATACAAKHRSRILVPRSLPRSSMPKCACLRHAAGTTAPCTRRHSRQATNTTPGSPPSPRGGASWTGRADGPPRGTTAGRVGHRHPPTGHISSAPTHARARRLGRPPPSSRRTTVLAVEVATARLPARYLPSWHAVALSAKAGPGVPPDARAATARGDRRRPRARCGRGFPRAGCRRL